MKIILATSAFMLATAVGAQTPPPSGTVQPMPSTTMPAPQTMPMTTLPNRTANPQPMPQPNPVNRPVTSMQPGVVLGATQPTPMAAPVGTGPDSYPVCSRTVTDRCVNPNDIRRGIATRPTRR